MSRNFSPMRWLARTLVVAACASVTASVALAQGAQAIDQEYTAKIREYLLDPRITTELVDHLPASSTVPTPLKFLGRIIGTPGELTRAADIHRYMKAIADAAPGRAKLWSIGKSEEGRDMIVLAIGNEETIRNLDRYKGYLAELTDPRRTSEQRARELFGVAKPVYYITSGMHSTEMGGPEMLMEMAYRLVVQETAFIQGIRNNVITMITPVIEVDGREKLVDECYFEAKNPGVNVPTAYWGKYVAHDNNRDGMGQMLALTKNVQKFGLEWNPTVLHDLHEAQTLLYASTGTGPYNEQVDPITVNEWWWMAQNDVMELTKRGVPGVWTYGFYDGWVPNYMFFIANTHNSIGRFYEVQSYGRSCVGATNAARGGGGGRGGAGGGGGRGGAGGAGAQNAPLTTVLGGSDYQQSREWFRPNPTPNDIRWSARANTNIQQSGVLFALWNMAREKDRFLENYYIKNRNAINRGKNGTVRGWVIPAAQHSKANAADAVNTLIEQGLEFHTANADFTAGTVPVKRGDYIIRGDQPFRTLADVYFSIQNYPTTNPSPYDDTGWTFQMMRNIVLNEVSDTSLFSAPMTKVTAPVRAPGGLNGAGATVIVEHTGDNNMVSLRYRFATTRMAAAEEPFEAAGRRFAAGSFIIPNANRAQLEPALRDLGLSGWGVAAAPTVKQHDLDLPRIGYIHSWGNTQDEGWVRAALDYYKIPYRYFGENEVKKMGRLRDRFDVILWPHGGAVGGPPTGNTPFPYKRSAEFTSLGYPDSTDDSRGGLEEVGLKSLYDFAQQGGTIITEGGTAAIFPRYSLTPGVSVDTDNPGLVLRGTIVRGIVTDTKSPIAYGFAVNQMPVYFNSAPVLDAGVPEAPADAPPLGKVSGAGRGGGRGAGGGGGGGRGGGAPVYQNTQPMATRIPKAIWEPMAMWPTGDAPAGDSAAAAAGGRGGRGAGGGAAAFVGGGRGGGGGGATILPGMAPRVIMQFPASSQDMLLTGLLAGGENLSNRAQVIDSPVGQGHIVMFAIRPFWRWQTQGTFIMGFNTLMNWNDLSAGK